MHIFVPTSARSSRTCAKWLFYRHRNHTTKRSAKYQKCCSLLSAHGLTSTVPCSIERHIYVRHRYAYTIYAHPYEKKKYANTASRHLTTRETSLLRCLLSSNRSNPMSDWSLNIVWPLNRPLEAVFGVFDLEAERSQFVADLVGGSPVLVLLRLQTDTEQEVDSTVESGKLIGHLRFVI